MGGRVYGSERYAVDLVGICDDFCNVVGRGRRRDAVEVGNQL